jgi:lipopolysaccharide assembly protein A
MPAGLQRPALTGEGITAMTEQPAFQSATTTLPPQAANGTSPQLPPEPKAPKSRRAHTRISGMRTSLIAGFALLVVVMIFIIQNAHVANISFLGAHLRLPLAVALFLAAIAGALIMAAAGTARITQLRQIMRRDRRKSRAS